MVLKAILKDDLKTGVNFVYPQKLVEKAEEIAQETGLEIEILDEVALEKGEYNGLINVGRGSKYPPRMIILRYTPALKTDRHIALERCNF